MDLKEKLRQLESLRGHPPVRSGSNSFRPSHLNVSPTTFPGAIRESENGRFFYHQRDFPLNQRHGIVEISTILKQPSSLLDLVGKHPIGSIDLRKLLFIDTETSGLSGGAGTFAFLVGIGYFTDDSFRVAQYFMNDFDEEHPLLTELNDLVGNHEMLVSYNGKCFDVPLLDSRNVFHRLKSPFFDLPHLDLLHAVRRMWGHQLADCSLKTAEQEILKIQRHGDIPGFLIPQVYFSYLQSKNPKLLQPIFYHNEQDVLSMLGLLSQLMEIFEHPLTHCHKMNQILAVGKVYQELQMLEEASDLYERFLVERAGLTDKRKVLFQLGFNYKKTKDWRRARETWLTCVETEAYHPLPYIELAKHYEHRENDYSSAIKLVEKALSELELLETLERGEPWQEYKADLSRRLQRLRSKLQKQA